MSHFERRLGLPQTVERAVLYTEAAVSLVSLPLTALLLSIFSEVFQAGVTGLWFEGVSNLGLLLLEGAFPQDSCLCSQS